MLFALLLSQLASASFFEPLPDTAGTCPKQNGTVGDYKMVLLASIWMGTACLVDKPGSGIGPVRGSNDLTIHGLWPGNNSSSWPECCNNSYPFNPTELSSVSDLKTNWVSTKGTDDKFYTHEWEKHGTCSMDLFRSERDYFQATVNLNKRLNIVGALRNAGIVPGTTLYQKSAVKSAIRAALGYDVLLECTTVSGQKSLSAVYTCLDHSASLRPQACSSDYVTKYENKCPSAFYLPAIPTSCYK